MANHQPGTSYVLCIDNGGYRASLEVRKVYVVLPDESAARSNFIRVIDETEEDYLYHESLFVPIEIPPQAAALFHNVNKIA